MAKHDLIVIGGGPGGYVAAILAAQLGLDVACVDEHDALGGTCLRVGCIPSKALLESSERFAEAREGLGDHGVELTGVQLDLDALLKRKDRIVSTLTRGIASLFKKNKVTRYTGRGVIDGKGKVTVRTEDSEEQHSAEHILLATGSRAASLPGIEFDEDGIIGTSTDALRYHPVPDKLVVIGGGYIGLELGSVWNRLGAEITVLEFLDRILPTTDREMAEEAQKLFEKQGIGIHLETKVTAATVRNGKAAVETEDGQTFEADRVLVAVGRRPNSEEIGLETLDIETDDKGFIRVDDHYRTSAEGVYAIGDVIGGAMLAHKAEEEGVACVERIATGYGHVNYEAIPAVVFTHPEIASVGRSEEQLSEDGVEYRKGVFPFRGNGRARTLNQVEGSVKVLADPETDRVLGVHILGPRAGDMIAEAAVAMEYGATAEDIARACHAHPTLAEALKEAALAVDNRTIHM